MEFEVQLVTSLDTLYKLPQNAGQYTVMRLNVFRPALNFHRQLFCFSFRKTTMYVGVLSSEIIT